MLQFVSTVSLVVMLSGLCLCPSQSTPQSCAVRVSATDRWATYRGAFFSVEYPPGFTVRPSQRAGFSFADSEPYESAFFTSPDGLVEFYVFSPQWDGEPTDILLNPETEKLSSTRTQTEARPCGTDASGHELSMRTRVTWVTVAARDGSYIRSYVDIRASDGRVGYPDDSILSRRTFGIQYADRSAYDRYRDRYLVFKRSLHQYADW